MDTIGRTVKKLTDKHNYPEILEIKQSKIIGVGNIILVVSHGLPPEVQKLIEKEAIPYQVVFRSP